MSNKDKKITLIILILLFTVLLTFIFNLTIKNNLFKLDADVNGISNYTYKDALKEVSDAYINKDKLNNGSIFSGGAGGVIQYDTYLKKFNFTPEDVQIDDINFTVCSNAIYQVYKETFGISLPYSTDELINYAKNRSYNKETKNYNEVNTKEVKIAIKSITQSDIDNYEEFNNNKTQENFEKLKTVDDYGLSSAKEMSQITDENEFYNKFTQKYAPISNNGSKELKVGDIIVVKFIGSKSLETKKITFNNNVKNVVTSFNEEGHALMVYSVDGSKVELFEANTYATINSSDLSKGYSSTNTLNASFNPLENNTLECSDFYDTMRGYLNFQNPGTSYLTSIAIIRPLEGRENEKVLTTSESLRKLQVENSFLKNKTITKATLDRLNNSGLVIYKESKVNNENTDVVMPNDTITYTLKFENKSNKTYTLPTVIENYDNNLVELNTSSISKPNGVSVSSTSPGSIRFTNIKLSKGEVVLVSYSVKVNDKNIARLNSKIISTGSVGNIKNATITKTVSYKLTNSEKQKFLSSINESYNEKYTGIAFVNRVYSKFYKKMGITTEEESTILYSGISASNIKLYMNNNSGILNSNNNFINQNYLNALGKNSWTTYHNVYKYSHKTLSSIFTNDKDNYTSDDWLNATNIWDNRKENYPLENNLNNGDIIWISDYNYETKEPNGEFVFIYYDGKIYGNYTSKMTFYNGSNVNNFTKFIGKNSVGVENNLNRFLSSLETYYAYAVFRPLNYYGLSNNMIFDDTFDLINEKLNIKDDIVILNENTTLNVLINKLGVNYIKVLDNNRELTLNEKIKTGNKLKIYAKEYLIAILGDINSDGKVTGTDVAKAYSMYNKKITYSNLEKLAADANEDGNITGSDVAKLYKMYTIKK